jgi:hypothetical protein
MPALTTFDVDRWIQALGLVALLLYLAPAAFGRGSSLVGVWFRRAAVVAFASAGVVALVETVLWFAAR